MQVVLETILCLQRFFSERIRKRLFWVVFLLHADQPGGHSGPSGGGQPLQIHKHVNYKGSGVSIHRRGVETGPVRLLSRCAFVLLGSAGRDEQQHLRGVRRLLDVRQSFGPAAAADQPHEGEDDGDEKILLRDKRGRVLVIRSEVTPAGQVMV